MRFQCCRAAQPQVSGRFVTLSRLSSLEHELLSAVRVLGLPTPVTPLRFVGRDSPSAEKLPLQSTAFSRQGVSQSAYNRNVHYTTYMTSATRARTDPVPVNATPEIATEMRARSGHGLSGAPQHEHAHVLACACTCPCWHVYGMCMHVPLLARARARTCTCVCTQAMASRQSAAHRTLDCGF